jgi:hypothetical protein
MEHAMYHHHLTPRRKKTQTIQHLHCSFCYASETQVGRLITTPTVKICDGCILLALETATEGIEDDAAFAAKISERIRIVHERCAAAAPKPDENGP